MVYKFGQLFEIIDGDRGKNYPGDSDFFDEGYCLFLNAGNVTKSGWSFESNAFIAKEKDEQLRKGRVNRGDTVFTTRGTVGNAAYYGDKVPFENIRINSGMVILRPKDEAIVDNEFIYYLVTSPLAKKTIELYCSGSAQPQLPIKDFVKIKYDLPSIAKQRQIVSVLNSFDNLIEVNNKQIKVLEQIAENLYKEWFVCFRFPGHESVPFENGLPRGWRLVRTSSICKITTGRKDANQADSQGKYPFFSCARENDLFSNDAFLDDKAIIVSGNGSFTGYTKCYRGKFDLYQRTYALYDINTISWQYLYWTYKLGFEKEYMGGNRGSAIPYITKPDIERYKIIVPDEKTLRAATDCFDTVYDLCEALKEENKKLIMQRDFLLPRLMSGKLEV